MNKKQLLDAILQIIYTIKEDKNKLEQVFTYLKEEVYQEPEEEELPEKYLKIVSTIADSIDAGFISYLNPETLEIKEFFQKGIFDIEEYEAITGKEYDSLDLENNFICFEPLESFESFQIMEEFVNNLKDARLQNKLINALDRRKPFANFKAIIDNSDFRQDWFDFKKQWMEKYVKELLMSQLDEIEEDDIPVYNGIYNDDGTKVDPETIPLPGLCIICKKYQIDDWDENLLCQLNRNDQRNEDEFKCGSFENI